MTERLIICARCSATIQQNTPLEHGSGLSVPGLCDGCRENDDRDKGPHALELISLGFYPAATCSCGRWGFTTSHLKGDTVESKRAMIETEHKRHVERSE